MATSQARIEANQRNAQLSTGPKTIEGKAQSRLNAFQHGLAGAGDLLAPGEDAALVAARTEAFSIEFQASGVAGAVLARRAAVLSVRMDQAQSDAEDAVRLQVQAARFEFDAECVSELDRLTDLLSRPQVMHAARIELEQMAEGIDRLLAFWDRQIALIEVSPPNAQAMQRVGSLLGLTVEQTASATPAELVERVRAEQARLRQVDASTRTDRRAALDRHRDLVGRMSRLDPSPQVWKIRRYDAAAERGFHRTVRAIRDLNRDQAHAARKAGTPAYVIASVSAASPVPISPPVVTPPDNSAPMAVLAQAVPAIPTSLGSFRPDIAVSASSQKPAVGAFDYARLHNELHPHKRRDVRKPKHKRR